MVTFGSDSRLVMVNDLPFYAYLILSKYGLEGFEISEAAHTHWSLYFKCQETGCCERCDYDHCDCHKGPPLSVNW